MPPLIGTYANLRPDVLTRIKIAPEVTHDDTVVEIRNPALKKVAEDTLDALSYSLTAVAAKPDMDVRAGSVEADFKAALKATPQASLAKVTANASSVLKAGPEGLRPLFGRFSQLPADAVARQGFDRAAEALPQIAFDATLFGVEQPSITVPLTSVRVARDGLLIGREILPGNFEEFESVGKIAFEDRLKTGVYDRTAFESVWGAVSEGDPFTASEFESVTTDKLGIFIRRIRCEDETDPEFWGDDEIALAGLSTDEDGEVKKINEVFIGSGFRDGTERTYGNWRYHSFSLRERNYWPKKFGVTFILAEKDNGGLSSFLNNLWEKVRGYVLDALKAAATAAGVALGVFLGIPEFGPLIGRALGEAVAWIIDKLVGWLIRLWEDDIFYPGTAWCTVPSMSARWYYPNGTWGNPWSPVKWFRFSGYGGRYLLEYQWHLYA